MNFKNVPAACDLDFDGFDGCFSFLEAGGCLIFSFLVAFAFFFVLLTLFTVNSSSSLSGGSLKSSSLPESGKAFLLFYCQKNKHSKSVIKQKYFRRAERLTTWCQFGLIVFIFICRLLPLLLSGFSGSLSLSGKGRCLLF